MTETQIIQATDKTLPGIAGEVLHGGKHEFVTDGVIDLRSCKKCYYCDTDDLEPECKVALTPDNAFKWRDWAVEKFGEDRYLLCLFIVWEYQTDDFKDDYRNEYLHGRWESKSIEILDIDCDRQFEFYKWAAIKIQPFDEILAACLCAEKGNSDEQRISK